MIQRVYHAFINSTCIVYVCYFFDCQKVLHKNVKLWEVSPTWIMYFHHIGIIQLKQLYFIWNFIFIKILHEETIYYKIFPMMPFLLAGHTETGPIKVMNVVVVFFFSNVFMQICKCTCTFLQLVLLNKKTCSEINI